MNFKLNKSVLENMLINLQSFLEKKDISAITSHVFIQAGHSEIVIKASDYEIGLQIITDQGNVTEAGSLTANGKKLLDIIRILKDEEVELYAQDNMLHIKQKKSKFKLPTFDANEFVQFPSTDNKPRIEIDSLQLIRSLKKITPAIDTNNPKFELNGALLDITSDTMSFVSTDTRRLSIMKTTSNAQSELMIIIPKKAIIEIQKLFIDKIDIFYDETHLMIKSANSFFFTKLINGKYPDYQRIIPKSINSTLTLNKSSMIEAIKQIITISNDVKLLIDSDAIYFESLSEDNIEAKTEMLLEHGLNEPLTLAVNSRYILDFLAQIETTEFSFELNDANLPFILKSGDFQTIIMPIII